MAILQDGKLGLEISFRQEHISGFIEYDVRFLWNNEPIVRDAVLKDDNEYWSDRLPGGFRVSDHGDDTLINCIRKSLDTSTAWNWEPYEDFISLQILPGILIDSLSSMWKAALDPGAPDFTKRYFKSVQEDLKSSKQDTVFMVIAMVDVFNLKDEDLFQGCGPSIVLHVTRTELERFVEEMSSEYQALKP